MIWRPTPMSEHYLPRGLRAFEVDTPDGVREYRAEIFGAVEHIPDYDDVDAIGAAYLSARADLGRQITQALVTADMVADCQDYQLTLTLALRVKAWPALEDFTVSKKSMPFDAS